MKAAIALAFWLRRLADRLDPPTGTLPSARAPRRQKYKPKVRGQLARISRRKNRGK